jgi:hypothetical protein
MAGAGTAGEKQVLEVESWANSGMNQYNQVMSRPKVLDTGLKCNITLAGTVICLEKIDDKKCPFASCGMEVNKRCSLVYKKVRMP